MNQAEMEQFVAFHHATSEDEQTVDRWQTLRQWDKTLLVAIVLASSASVLMLIVLMIPLAFAVMNSLGYDASAILSPVGWFTQTSRALLVGGVLALAVFVSVLVGRQRVLREHSFWADDGCPRCHEHELVRIPRRDSDRLFRYLNLPVRRYACRSCTWRGRRLCCDILQNPEGRLRIIDLDHTEK